MENLKVGYNNYFRFSNFHQRDFQIVIIKPNQSNLANHNKCTEHNEPIRTGGQYKEMVSLSRDLLSGSRLKNLFCQ